VTTSGFEKGGASFSEHRLKSIFALLFSTSETGLLDPERELLLAALPPFDLFLLPGRFFCQIQDSRPPERLLHEAVLSVYFIFEEVPWPGISPYGVKYSYSG